MIIKNMKKVLSSIIIAIFTIVYSAPVGLCLPDAQPSTSTAAITAAVNKPILRAAPQASALKLEGEILLSKGNPKVNLSLRDSDVKQVLRMFADKAGLNIIFHDSVSGKVTMDLVNVPLNDAFKMVMQVTSLTYFIDKNTMIVTSSEAALKLNLSKQEMMTIPVKYANASAVADFLNKNIFSINKPGLSNAQIAITNPGTNEILIFGTNNDYLMAKKVVAQFDIKPKEETFVVNHTTPKEMSDLICGMLLNTSSGSSGGSSSSGSGSSGGGSATGGAAGLSLGTGVLACKSSNSLTAGALSSLNTNSLSVTYFTQRGTISVMGGSQQQIEMIKDFILANDKKQQQAYLELSIIELNESGSKDFSNTWQVYNEFFSGGFNGTTATNPNFVNYLQGNQYPVIDPTDTNNYPDPSYYLKKYSGAPTVTYSMSYLISNGKGRVLANPRIMITNGETSTVDLSSDYIKSIKTEVLNGSLTGATQKTFTIGNDEGIKVELLPFISPDGYVTLNIKPQYSTIKEKVYTTSSTTSGTGPTTTVSDLAATLLQRRNLDLKNVRIKDGETLVIGGMIRENETKTVAKIPVLGDLPGVGMFFRNTSTTKEKQELVIMITPKIIKDSEDVVNNQDATL